MKPPLARRVLDHVGWRIGRIRQVLSDEVTRRRHWSGSVGKEYQLPEVELEWLIGERTKHIPLPALIMDDIGMPPYQYCSHDDITPLLRLAAHLQPSIVVELGTAHGNTAANLCRTCPNAHVVTVNASAPQQTGGIATFWLNEDEIGRVYRKHAFTDRVTQVYQNTLQLDLHDKVESKSIDLAIIDACHDTEYVINDFKKLKPYLKEGSIVFFHDTHPSMWRHLAGSYLGCMQLRKEGYDIRHLKNTWWGVLKFEGDRTDKGGS